MKKVLSLILCLAMVISLAVPSAIAAEWTNGPTFSLSATDVDNEGGIVVTLEMKGTDEDYLGAVTLNLVYDASKVEPDSTKGTVKKGGKLIGLTIPECISEFPTKSPNPAASKTVNGEKVTAFSFAGTCDSEADTNDLHAVGASSKIIYYFKVKQGAVGTADFMLATDNDGNFKVTDFSGDRNVARPASGSLSAPVAIPATEVTVTGTIDAQLKGNTAPTVDLTVTDGFKVEPTWSPALKDGKFEAGKTYTLTVKVSEDGGKFATNATVTADKALELSSFTKSGSAFTATRTFTIPDKALTAIEVTTQPSKTSYVDGDKFDPAGMVVKATYDDGSTDDNFTDYTTAPETLTKGDDTVTLTAAADKTITTTVQITVEGKEDGFAAEFTPDKLSEAYTGADLSETLTKQIKAENITGQVTYSFRQDGKEVAPVDVGEYEVYATVTGDEHYKDGVTAKIATATVTAKEVSPTIEKIDDQDYTGEQIKPAITVTCGSDKLEEGADYTVEYGENKNVSDGGTVTIKPVEGSNYTFAEVTQKFNIKPIVAQIEWTKETKLTYTGEEQSVTAEITNLVKGDKAELTYEQNTATDVGEYTAKATGVDNDNYTLDGAKNLEQAWSIAKADYKGDALTGKTTVPTKGATDKTYALSQLNLPKEFVDTSVTDVKFDGIVTAAKADGETIVFSAKEAEDGDTGTITLTIASKNYNDVTATVTVTAKDVVVPDNFWTDNVETADIEYGQTVGDAVKIKNAAPSIQDGNGNALAGELKVDSAEVVPNAGEAKATVTFTVTADGDYKDTAITQEVTFTVKQKEVKVNWADTELTYNGEAQKPTATAEGVNNEKLTLTVSGEQTDAGEYKATAELTEVVDGNARVENYKLTDAETDFTIKPAEISGVVKIEPAENVTKGTELKANADDVTGDELTYQWFKDGKAIEGATGETYTTTIDDVNSKITVTVTSTGNYEGSLDSAAVTVEKSELTGEITIAGEDELTATVKTDDPDAADYYDIVWMCEGKQVGTGETFTVTSAVRGKTVTAKAVAKDKYTGELVSNELEIPATAPSFESAPEITEGNGALTVTLNAEPNGAEITEYTITVTDPDGNETVIKVPGTESSYTIPDLENGTTYTVTVTATNEKGSTTSDPVTGTPKRNDLPVLPPDVTPGTNPNPNPNPEPEQNPDTFADVEKGSFYEDAVKWAVDNGITTGKSSLFFAPYEVCTRAETVTFLWRAAGKPTPASTVNPFIDVAPDAFYYTAVLWAAEQGITTGTSADTFSPNETVSRGQMVTFLWRAAGKPAANAANPFADVAADAYYTDAVLWAVAKGITNGTSATTFSPDAGCTRAQIVTFLYRFYA